MKKWEYVSLFLVTVAIVALISTGTRQVFYNLVYEDMVEETIIKMVKKEALNGE